MPGPAPKPESQRRRRNAAPQTTRLPLAGREGDLPAWPLAGRQSKREAELWERLWKTPQAVAWELLGWTDTVGRYARLLAVAEKPKAPAMILAEVRQMEDRLGLTPMSMLRLRWEIVDEEGAAQPEPGAAVLDIRARLRAVD